MPVREPAEDPKVTALRESRCLNPDPGRVTDPAFLAEEFFDARDTVQVKYEMVRRVTVDSEPVTATAAAFGYSRPSYYQAAAALAASGLEGLVPARPGPRRGHKLTGQILTWAEEQLAADPALAGRPGRAHRRAVRRARAPPLHRASAGPLPGALQRPLTHPPPNAGRRRTRPCLCDLHLASRLLNRMPIGMPARSPLPAAGWTPVTSSCVMLPCTHARRRSRSASACSPARASPHGGVSWRTRAAAPPPPGRHCLPQPARRWHRCRARQPPPSSSTSWLPSR